MKKNKRILALASAAAMSCTLLSPVSSNAMIGFGNNSSVLDGYTECEDYSLFSGAFYDQNSKYYYKVKNDKTMYLIKTDHVSCRVDLTCSEGIEPDDIKSVIKEIRPDAVVGNYIHGLCIRGYASGSVSDEVHNKLNLTVAQARQMCEALKEKGYIEEFKYVSFDITFEEFSEFSLPFYYPSDKEVVKEYIEENGYDFTFTESSGDGITLYSDMNIKEAFDIASQMAKDTGARPLMMMLASAGMGAADIDMFNAIDGDANEDGNVDMADAVSILQAVANPDKYALSAQGRFNGDVSNTGDGITAQDALVIQRRLLKLE